MTAAIAFKGSRDMNAVRIDQLRGQPTETEWLEFKRNRYDRRTAQQG